MNNPAAGSQAVISNDAVSIRNARGTHEEKAAPLAGNSKVPFLTPGVWVLIALALGAVAVLAVRFTQGLGAVTNLDNNYPWGLWIAIDVASGVALAAGGFTMAFLAHIFHKNQYHVLVRPALLTAMIGYTFVALGVVVDLGRFYNIWHVMMPSMWQGNSVLFEVGICVMIYLTVLYIEFLPIVCERFIGKVNLPGFWAGLNKPLDRLLRALDAGLNKVIIFFLIAGVVLSCAHQSSLGTLMVIAPGKLHTLWYTPMMPLQFLLSAFAVGLSMVIFEGYLASRSLKREFELNVMAPLGRIIPFLLTVYFGTKLIDVVNRGAYKALGEFNLQTAMYGVEIIGGVLLPAFIFMAHRLRRQPAWLFTAAAMVVIGVVINRINVFIIGYEPQFGSGPYVPAWPEALLTIGFISIIVLIYRAAVFIFPVLPEEED
jgi:Ni/Fe-hydrogenase subunit HybB-like protein|nr:Ni/Fe-hydrogenase cytochrome b subunit [Candidatus Krumholzibacteria bacterium]